MKYPRDVDWKEVEEIVKLIPSNMSGYELSYENSDTLPWGDISNLNPINYNSEAQLHYMEGVFTVLAYLPIKRQKQIMMRLRKQ